MRFRLLHLMTLITVVIVGFAFAGQAAAESKIYWIEIDHRSTSTIQRANLDGSGVEALVTTGLISPRGIALDVAGGKMYWTDGVGTGEDHEGKVRRANLDGSGVEDLVTTRLFFSFPAAIALDVAGGKVYWTDLWAQTKARFGGQIWMAVASKTWCPAGSGRLG